LRNIMSGRRPKSPAITWNKGPVVVIVDGQQRPAVAALLRQAMASIGAQ